MAIEISGVSEDGGYGVGLAPGERRVGRYAASAVASRGRFHGEPECQTRAPFQRDRDRILHSTAFRRLTYKTQVFLPHEGDHFRTRLTHSLEVAQIARTVARQLQLDEDLAEALALAHDLGHSPFGHAGERVLDAAMTDHGGFDHNAQSLRVVMGLERKYLDFDGLNLTWETLEGLAKHNGPVNPGSAVGKVVRAVETWQPLDLHNWPSAEAQVASLADDIAYLSHDIDDGLRARLLTLDSLASAPFAGSIARAAGERTMGVESGRAIYEVTRRMITVMIADLVCESRRRLAALAPRSPDEIRTAGHPVVAFSEPVQRDLIALKSFLFQAVYHHSKVLTVMAEAEGLVRDLFGRYAAADGAALLPAAWQTALQAADPRRRMRVVCDYIAGQTDRYAIAEHARLFATTPDLR